MKNQSDWHKDESRSADCPHCHGDNTVHWWIQYYEYDRAQVKQRCCDVCDYQTREIDVYQAQEQERFECPKCKSSALDWRGGDTDYHNCPVLQKRTDHSYDKVKCEDCGHCFYILRYSCGCDSEYEELDKFDDCEES